MNRGLTHSGNVDLARHMSHVVTKTGGGGTRLAKESKNSSRKIDLAIAAVMAVDRAAVLMSQPRPRMYSIAKVLQEIDAGR